MQSDERPHRRHRAIVSRALDCVGTPFHRQGRTPGLGLDCVGLILEAAAAAGMTEIGCIAGYTLSGDHDDRVLSTLEQQGCTVRPAGVMHAGDLLLFAPALRRRHFAILADRQMIHAHFALGKVVVQPLPDDLPLLSVWRFPERDD